jgi:hypothetical protein
MSLPNCTVPEQHDRARPSLHQEADHGEPRFPVRGGSVDNDRRLRSDAGNPQRADPLGSQGRSYCSATVHPHNLRCRCVALTGQMLVALTPLACLQQNLRGQPWSSSAPRSSALNVTTKGESDSAYCWAAPQFENALREPPHHYPSDRVHDRSGLKELSPVLLSRHLLQPTSKTMVPFRPASLPSHRRTGDPPTTYFGKEY